MASDNGRKRVVITGMGAVTPLGNDAETFWKNLTAGECGAGADHALRPDRVRRSLRLRAEGLRPDEVDRAPQGAADRPLRADDPRRGAAWPRRTPGFEIEPETERTGVSVATGIGGLQSFQDCDDKLLERGPDRVNPLSIPAIIPNMGAAWVSMELGTRGPLTSQCTACAASNMAIGEAMDAIRLGRADVMLAGGTEAGITKVGIGGFGGDARALAAKRRPEAARAARSTPSATGSSWARPARSSCSRSSSTRRRAARRSTPSCSATASPPTRSTSPSPTRPAGTRRGR